MAKLDTSLAGQTIPLEGLVTLPPATRSRASSFPKRKAQKAIFESTPGKTGFSL